MFLILNLTNIFLKCTQTITVNGRTNVFCKHTGLASSISATEKVNFSNLKKKIGGERYRSRLDLLTWRAWKSWANVSVHYAFDGFFKCRIFASIQFSLSFQAPKIAQASPPLNKINCNTRLQCFTFLLCWVFVQHCMYFLKIIYIFILSKQSKTGKYWLALQLCRRRKVEIICNELLFFLQYEAAGKKKELHHQHQA